MHEVAMRWTALTAVTAAVTVVLATWPAEAQTRKRARVSLERPQVTRTTVRVNRPATRITVRKARSYLDPGTEVLPMSRSYTDYALPPQYTPNDAWDPARARRYPLPDNFYLPGYYR